MTDDDLEISPADEPRPGSPAVYARNWRTVLAVDALMGLAVVALGAFVAVHTNIAVGAAIAVLGAAYCTLVAQRARQWRVWRREAGLG